jgi:pSer/pThr/pTyr-binding forkhead associated (FHA) protein
LQTLEGHTAAVQSAVFSPDSSYLLSGSADNTSKLWVLDWDLSQPLQDWDEGAKPYLETFLLLHTPRAAALPPQPSETDLVRALSRRGAPEWNDADFDALIQTLGNAGYGWLRSSRVRRHLMAMTTEAIVKLAAEPEVGGTVSATVFDTAYSTAFATVAGDFPATSKVILTVTEGTLKGQQFEFNDRAIWVLGRAKDCNLQLPNDKQHEKISRYHCKLIINPPSIQIQDLGSLHGTYVNGQMIGRRTANQSPSEITRSTFPEHALADGDEINLGGKTVLQVQIKEAVPETSTTAVATAMGTSILEQTVFIPRSQTAPSGGQNSVGESDRPAIEGYTLLQELGRGTSSTVYLARNPQQEVVALKILQPKPVQIALVEALLPEVERMKALQHPNIVQLLQGGYRDGTFFFAQEYCAGGSVANLIQTSGRVSVDRAVTILLQALDGLEYAHRVEGQEFPHGSLKPANLLLTQQQGTQVVKIADYGLMNAFDRAGFDLVSRSSTADAIAFLPRQWATQSTDTKTEIDIWAIAACFYAMLTGVPPRDFSDKNPYLALLQTNPVPIHQRNSQIPKPLAELIDIALSDQREIHFKDVTAFRSALNSVL